MTQLFSLIWKEWRETRAYLFIGLGLFLGLPIIGAIEDRASQSVHFTLITVPWVTYAGGMLAIFTAVGSTCRDLNSRLEDFWRSRPVTAARWIVIKFFIGLTVVLAACMIPLLAENAFDPSDEVRNVTAFYPFHWVAVYSLAFLAGCLLRRTAHAAVLGVAAMLLILFLPILLPPLAWMNLSNFIPSTNQPLWGVRQIGYAAGMLGIAIVATIISTNAVSRDWHIESGMKMIYSSSAAAFVILCATASFQVGTDLPIIQQVALPPHAETESLYFSKDAGDLFCLYPDGNVWQRFHYDVEINASGMSLNHPTKTNDTMWWREPHAILPDGTRVWYELRDPDFHLGPIKLIAIRQTLDHHALPVFQTPLQIWTGRDNGDHPYFCIPNGKNLIVMETARPRHGGMWHRNASRISVLDISTPLDPKLISDQNYADGQRPYTLDSDQLDFLFHPIAGVTSQQRLKIEMQFQGLAPFDGEMLCLHFGDNIDIYRLTNLTEKSARFKKIDTAQRTILDRVFGYEFHGDGSLQLTNGLLYAGRGFGHYLFPSIVVYDLHGKDPGKIVGHFAAPEITALCPLSDGRMLVAGDHLWLVGSPRKANSN